MTRHPIGNPTAAPGAASGPDPVVVVGGGPSGLAAATELLARGVGPVVVLEREPVAGGIPRHCDHYPFGARELHRVLRGPDYAARLAARAVDAGADVRTARSVMALHPGPRLTVATPDDVVELAARRVLLCTGVREASRVARRVGGTKPGGVMSTAALQGLVHLEGLRPFRRPVIYGSELVSFSAILTCRHLGIRPAAMIEPGPRPLARWPSAWLPRLLGIPLLTDTELVAIEGRDRVEAVTLRTGDGEPFRIDTDGVIVSGRFRPDATLVRDGHLALDPGTGGPEVDQYGRCSDPDYFAAGNVLRSAESAGWSWREGRAAARAVACDLAGDLPSPENALRVRARGDALKLVLPQRVTSVSPGHAPARGCGAPALEAFQLRVTRSVRGRLVLRLNGEPVVDRPLSAHPERRVLVPLSVVPPGARGELELSLESVAPVESGGRAATADAP